MELQGILPDIIKEVVKQTMESIMMAEREVFLREHGGIKKPVSREEFGYNR